MTRKEAYLSDWTAAVESAAEKHADSAKDASEFSRRYVGVWKDAITSQGRA